jgi:transcriptional regulator with XRE-family HTH domain
MPATSHPAIDTNWFQAQLADKRMSQRRLAALMGLDPGALSLMLHGKRKMSAEEVAEIARLLNVDATEVLTRAGVAGQTYEKKSPAAKPEKDRQSATTTTTTTTATTTAKGLGTGVDAAADFEAEFLRKWLDLGLMLLRNRGPI